MHRLIVFSLIALAGVLCPISSGTFAQTLPPVVLQKIQAAQQHVTTIGMEDYRKVVDSPGEAIIIDVREPHEFAAGHVPGARNHPFTLNLRADGRMLPASDLRRHWLEFLRGEPATRVISMCGSGVTACQNLLALEVAGLPGAALYAGSWSEWIRDPARGVARGNG